MLLDLLRSPNLLWAEWISLSTSVSLIGVLVIYYSSLVPEGIQRVFKYGKAAEIHVDGVGKLHKFELPKRWFYHFYLFAILFYAGLGWSVLQVYLFRGQVPVVVSKLLDSFVGTHRRSSVAPESVMLATALILLQGCRRLFECIFLSVYSDAKMNIVHYIFGYSFYFGVGMSVLAEAPGFAGKAAVPEVAHLTQHFLTWNHVLGVLIFIWSSVLQYNSHAILAKLRKDSQGRIVTYSHSIPEGGWFELISCPHYLAEILIYLSLCLVLGGRSTTWWMVCCFVVTNQVVVGLFNHQYYLETFPKYPKARKAVIPFLL